MTSVKLINHSSSTADWNYLLNLWIGYPVELLFTNELRFKKTKLKVLRTH